MLRFGQILLFYFMSMTGGALLLIFYVFYVMTPQPTTQNLPPSDDVALEKLYEAGHVHDNYHICNNHGDGLTLLVIIASAPPHEEARMAIRKTWGTFALREDVAVAFILGSSINKTINTNILKEQKLYRDIIQGQFIDGYTNLTIKSVTMLEWVQKFCFKAKYLLKADDDVFINLPRLLELISRGIYDNRAIYGRVGTKWIPVRDETSKYYVSPQQYKADIYPDYATGPAYLFRANLAKELYETSLTIPFFIFEDIFITGMVADIAKIKKIHDPELMNQRFLCKYVVPRRVSVHEVSSLEQYQLWRDLHDTSSKKNFISLFVSGLCNLYNKFSIE